MIFIFKRNLFVNSVLLLPYCFLLRIKSFLQPYPEPSNYTCSSWLDQWITEFLPSPLYLSILSVLMLFIQAVYLNHIVIKHRITKEYTLFPGMVYLLLTAIFAEYLAFTSLIFANGFILLALSNIVGVYKKSKPEKAHFMSGFWTGLAGVISFHYFLFLIPLIFGYTSLRSFKLREVFQILTGLLSVVFFFLAMNFYLKDLWALTSYSEMKFSIPSIDIRPDIVIFLLFVLLIVLLGVFLYNQILLRKSLQSKKRVSIIFWMLLFSIPVAFLSCGENLLLLYFFFISFSVLVSMLIINTRSLVFAEILHILALLFLFNQHFDLLNKIQLLG